MGALGILAAGGCYVAMDPDYPDDRLKFMLADSGAQVVVAKAYGAKRIGAPRGVDPMQPAAVAPAAPVAVAAGDAAYIVYTSGSTGRPKGVLIDHAALGNLIDWHENAFDTTESDRKRADIESRLRRGCLGDLAVPGRWRIAAHPAGLCEDRSHCAARLVAG